jgi:bifunctional ADP-heptose synthase (sugar kinase/adenylyltransferase)
MLKAVVEMNHALRVDHETQANPGMLNKVLEAVGRLAGHDYLIVVISDFEGADDHTRRQMLRLAQHNDLIGVVVHDPSATDFPAVDDLVITDGELQIELELGKQKVRRKVAESVHGRISEVLAWQQEIRVPMLPITTAEGVAEQVRHLLGYAPRGR